MKLLAIDTSLADGSVAAVDELGGGEIRLGSARDHARRLGPAMEQAARSRGWRVGEATVVAVVRGPGSFTGLRVGVSAAKALAWASGARLVGVSAVEVVARQTARLTGRSDQPVAVAFDAGRGEVFATVARPRIEAPGRWDVGTPRLLPLARWLETLSPELQVSGPALVGCIDRLSHGVAAAPPEAWRPGALETAAIARLSVAAGEFDDPMTLVPLYIRPSYAEEREPPPRT
jgi:tRNA threonylcarbamoyladenosine biosynthesis protein TsaB